MGRAIDLLLLNADVLGQLIRIARVGVDFRTILPAAEKVEWYVEVATVPVGHAAEIPLFTVASRDGDELARFAAQHVSFIPRGRYALDELERGLILISRGMV